MIGKYKLTEDCRPVIGVTAFTALKGRQVEVKQYDVSGRQILVDFGGGCIGWFHKSFLQKCTVNIK